MQLSNLLYVTEYRAKVGVNRGSIIVRGGRDTTKVPIEGLESIVLFGGQITGEALTLCTQKGVRVTALHRSGRIRYVVGTPTKGNVLLRVAQVHAHDNVTQSAAIASSIVAAKLESYRRLILRWAWDASPGDRAALRTAAALIGSRVHNLAGASNGDYIRGVEGDGTRIYFGSLRTVLLATDNAASVFLTRSRRPPRDPVNAVLSFLYALALIEILGGLEAVGLDAQIGFLHDLRPGRPALGLDLLEEVRPVQDRLAVRMLRRRQLRIEHFVTMSNGAWFLSDEGRRTVLELHGEYRLSTTYHTLMDRQIERWSLSALQATLLARHLRGDLKAYAPYVLVA